MSSTAARGRAASSTGKSKKPTSNNPVLDIINNRPYRYNLADGSFIAYYTEDMVDYTDVVFLVNGTMPDHAHYLSMSRDGCQVILSEASSTSSTQRMHSGFS
jgi:hypothetical protein